MGQLFTAGKVTPDGLVFCWGVAVQWAMWVKGTRDCPHLKPNRIVSQRTVSLKEMRLSLGSSKYSIPLMWSALPDASAAAQDSGFIRTAGIKP